MCLCVHFTGIWNLKSPFLLLVFIFRIKYTFPKWHTMVTIITIHKELYSWYSRNHIKMTYCKYHSVILFQAISMIYTACLHNINVNSYKNLKGLKHNFQTMPFEPVKFAYEKSILVRRKLFDILLMPSMPLVHLSWVLLDFRIKWRVTHWFSKCIFYRTPEKNLISRWMDFSLCWIDWVNRSDFKWQPGYL